MNISPASRLQQLPPYLFAKIDEIKKAELAKGKKLLSLGIGDPDLPMPEFVRRRLEEALRDPSTHQYPSYWGMPDFRKAASEFLQARFGVSASPENQILTLIGSKEGLAHLPLALVSPGDGVLVPDPGYPVYHSATLFAGGTPLHFTLKRENHYLPDFDELEKLVKSHGRVKLLFLNYPNNPTSAVAPAAFFAEVVKFAQKHDIVVCHDNAYSEIYLGSERPLSFLQTPGASDVGIELHSLSKSFNMAGCRLGFAAGNAKVLAALAQVKTNIDSGAFNAIQIAGATALRQPEPFGSEIRSVYRSRRDALIPALKKTSLDVTSPEATFYVWCRLPEGTNSLDYVVKLITERGVVAMPGTGFGPGGEGYIRFALCADISVLKAAAAQLSN